MTQHSSPVTEQLFQSCLSELTEGHLALDRLGAPREVQEGDVIRECLIAERISSVAQSTLIPAGKQARFKNEKSWFAVFDWHNDPESFEYRTVYALEALVGIEYAANKASLTDSERLLDIRIMVESALRRLVGGAQGD